MRPNEQNLFSSHHLFGVLKNEMFLKKEKTQKFHYNFCTFIEVISFNLFDITFI